MDEDTLGPVAFMETEILGKNAINFVDDATCVIVHIQVLCDDSDAHDSGAPTPFISIINPIPIPISMS